MAGPCYYIEGDTFWSFIVKGAGGSPQKNFKMTMTAMTAMTAAALPYALYGYDVILDFSIPPWFIETAHKVIRNKVPVHYVVLCPSEKVCAARAAGRLEVKIADYKHYHDLYKSFDEAQRYIIPDGTSDASVIATYVRAGIAEGVFRIDVT